MAERKNPILATEPTAKFRAINPKHRKVHSMASNEAIEFADFLATLSSRSSDPRLDLPTIRDIIESVHLATKEPEGVSYVEADAGGVEALWCIPAGGSDSAVLLHNHMGGTVVASMYSD